MRVLVRRIALGLTALPLAGAVVALAAPAGAAPVFAATASVAGGPQYLGDATGTAFTLTVTNTGVETPIGAVEIQRPSIGWSITSCGAAPAGWTVQKADPKCRFRSAEGAQDDLQPGQSLQLTVTVTTLPGTADRVGTWGVTVSKSNQFDQPSVLTAASATENGLRAVAHTFEVLDAAVSTGAVAAGSACPPADKDERTSTTVAIVLCGRNRATVPLTPSAAHSSLGGTFLASPGTFSSGLVIPGDTVVLGSWTGARVAALPGTGLTVVARVASAATETSPLTTLGGYEAINVAPTAVADAYTVAEDGALSIAAPGVLANDTDPEGQPITAALDAGPAHALSFHLHSDGSFTYTPAANFAGTDTFTYTVSDGTNASPPATVTITVTGVNDAPVLSSPGSVSVLEDAPYAFGAGAISVADVDAGSGDVEVGLSVANATLTVGTSGVTVTGNGTGAVTLTGPLTAVNAALDAATLAPAPDFFGTSTLALTASDLGHTGSGGALTDTDSVAVAVLGVNDAPSFTPGADLTSAEDAGLQTVAGWATDVTAGPRESGQALTFTVTTDNPALFATAPAVSPAGTLTYRAAANAYGVATVTVTLSDDGGTANGGADTSAPATFTITVSAVNDPPVAVDQAFTAQANMARHVTGLLAGAADPHDAGQAFTTVSLGSVTPLSCAGCVVSNVSADGSFDFAPPPGFTGTVTLAYTVVDDGYPAPGVSSAPATITVTVQGPVIWFVDGSASGTGTGTLTDPFQALSSAAAVASAPGSRVFVSSGPATGSLTLAPNGWLIGQGVSGTSFDEVFGITPPDGTAPRPAVGGTRPAVAGGVTLADDSVVRGLDLVPTGVTGLAGSGADRVTVNEVSVSATGARAVDLASSQGSTVALDGASATGGPGGIRLDTVNTTAPGSVTVTGGTITGTSGSGVSLAAVNDVALSGLSVARAGGNGIGGTGVADVSVTDVTVSDSTGHGVALTGVTGSIGLTRVTASASGGDNARVAGSAGTAAVSVTDSTFQDNDPATGGNGLLVEATGTSELAFTSTGSSFLRNNQDALAVVAQSARPVTATITDSTVVMDGGAGIDLVSNGTGGLAYTVDRGTVSGCATCGVPVNVYKATGGTGTGANALAGTISNLVVSNADSPNAPGIWVHGEGAGAQRVAVTGNTVTGIGHIGILAAAGNGGSTLDATVTGNTVTLGASGLQGIQVDSGTLTGDTTSVCADIRTNTVTSPTADVRVRNRMAGTTFRLPGYTGPATSTSSVVAFEIAQNTITDAAAVVGSSPGFGGGVACAAP